MKSNYSKLAAIAGLSLCLGTGQAFAAPIEITVRDPADPLNNTFLPGDPVFVANGFNGGHAGQASEDNETERTPQVTATANQAWDMEAFTLDGKTLSIVGGFNMSTGVAGHSWRPGDLFIKVGGAAPDAGTLSGTTVANSAFGSGFDTNGYTWVVDLSLAGGISNVASTATTAYKLDGSSILNTVNWDTFLSNPWTYGSGAVETKSTTLNYSIDQTAAGVASITGVASMANLKHNDNVYNYGTGEAYDAHNVLNVDLTFLGDIAPNTPVYFHYVMECGNDMIKGQYSGGFDLVPDHGNSLMMIGLGLASLTLAGISRRKR